MYRRISKRITLIGGASNYCWFSTSRRFVSEKWKIYLKSQLFIKSLVWTHYHCQLTASHLRTVQLLLELLFVKFGYFSVSCHSSGWYYLCHWLFVLPDVWCLRCYMYKILGVWFMRLGWCNATASCLWWCNGQTNPRSYWISIELFHNGWLDPLTTRVRWRNVSQRYN